MLNFAPMAKKSTHVAIEKHPRPGEGVALQTTVRRDVTTSGRTGQLISVDLTQAPVPDRRYVSDAAAIVADEHELKVCFAQRKLASDSLRSMLVVHIPYEGVYRFLESLDGFVSTLKEFAKKVDLAKAQLMDIKEEPAQTVALTANIVGVSFSGRDACLDFYHTSAFAIMALKSGGPFVVDPVVRVTLTSGQLLSIIERVQAMKDSFPRREEPI